MKTSYTLKIGERFDLHEIKEAIQSDKELIILLVGDVGSLDARAVYVDDSFEIEDICLCSDGYYTVDFRYDWEAYYGCRDMNKCDTEWDAATFSYSCGNLVFEFPEKAERTTYEEF